MENPLQKIAGEFSQRYPVMQDLDRRRRRGLKAASILRDMLRGRNASIVLDVGCSNAVFLDVVVKELNAQLGLGVDLDRAALPKPTSRRVGLVGSALALPLPDSSVDLILCNHTYEHVPNVFTLFEEIRRVLKPGGIVYFGAMNSRWPIEPHYHLPFIHWLPTRWSMPIMQLLGYEMGYLEQPLSPPKLRRLVHNFELHDYTLKVIKDPKQYCADDIVYAKLTWAFYPLAKFFYGFLPGYLWVLVKRSKYNIQSPDLGLPVAVVPIVTPIKCS